MEDYETWPGDPYCWQTDELSYGWHAWARENGIEVDGDEVILDYEEYYYG